MWALHSLLGLDLAQFLPTDHPRLAALWAFSFQFFRDKRSPWKTFSSNQALNFSGLVLLIQLFFCFCVFSFYKIQVRHDALEKLLMLKATKSWARPSLLTFRSTCDSMLCFSLIGVGHGWSFGPEALPSHPQYFPHVWDRSVGHMADPKMYSIKFWGPETDMISC